MALAHYILNLRDDIAWKTIGFDSIPPDSVIDAAIEAWALSGNGGPSVDIRWKLHDRHEILSYGWRNGDLAWQDSPRLTGGDQ
jgi:hypothetical protein